MQKHLSTLLVACFVASCAEDDGSADFNSLPLLEAGAADANVLDSSYSPVLVQDGGFGFPDASYTFQDASYAADANVDAGRSDGSTPSDAATGSADAAVTGDAGTPCPGSATPHGCYTAKAGNDPKCPPQIYEQSGFYPPMEEWKGCESPWYQACVYLRPNGTEANCSCDFGLHWLCTY